LVDYLKGNVSDLNELKKLIENWQEANNYQKDATWTGYPATDAVMVSIKREDGLYTFAVKLEDVT
jgi:hypothetical protein